MEFEEIVNKVCRHLPKSHELILFMENGAAWFEMYDHSATDQGKFNIELGDPADKSLTEQINDALAIANGFEV